MGNQAIKSSSFDLKQAEVSICPQWVIFNNDPFKRWNTLLLNVKILGQQNFVFKTSKSKITETS